MTRCRVGDLAIVICDPDCGNVNLGVIVRVVGLSENSRPGMPEWICQDDGRMKAAIDGYDINQRHLIDIPDASLLPIRPGDISDEEVKELFAPTTSIEEKENAA